MRFFHFAINMSIFVISYFIIFTSCASLAPKLTTRSIKPPAFVALDGSEQLTPQVKPHQYFHNLNENDINLAQPDDHNDNDVLEKLSDKSYVEYHKSFNLIRQRLLMSALKDHVLDEKASSQKPQFLRKLMAMNNTDIASSASTEDDALESEVHEQYNSTIDSDTRSVQPRIERTKTDYYI